MRCEGEGGADLILIIDCMVPAPATVSRGESPIQRILLQGTELAGEHNREFTSGLNKGFLSKL